MDNLATEHTHWNGLVVGTIRKVWFQIANGGKLPYRMAARHDCNAPKLRHSHRIDIQLPQEHFDADMKFLFRHFLLLGVILGLAGQGVAFAATPCAVMQMEQASAKAEPMAGMGDCAMGQHKTDKGSTPCKDMSLGCLAMAGCAALAAIDVSPAVLTSPLPLAAVAAWPATPVLLGRSIAPDPDPPSLLG